LRPQHRGLDRAQDLKLGRYRGDPLAHLEQVGADPLVGALPRQLLGDPGDVVAGVGDGLRRRNQLPLAALVVVVDQLGEAGHQHGHPLGGGDEVVVLGGPLAHLAVQVVGGDLRTKTKQRVESRGSLGSDGRTMIGWLALGACLNTSSSSSVSGGGGRIGAPSCGRGGLGGAISLSIK
jgi:hypothetical protein